MSGAITAGTLATVAGIGAAGSIGAGIIGANAAGNAADKQSQAAMTAAQLQSQASQNALDFQKQQYADSQKNLAPYLQAGQTNLASLQQLLGTASNPGSLLQPYGKTFSAPTAQDLQQNDPGYQARLNLGTQALQQSAAARGNLLTGGTAQALNQFAQDYASNEYSNYYNQALNTFQTNYNVHANDQANQFNRLAAGAGAGQSAVNTLGVLGQNAANSESSNVLGTAAQVGQDYQNAGAANASGIVGAANAYGGALTGSTSGLSNLLLLQQLSGGVGKGGPLFPSGNELGG